MKFHDFGKAATAYNALDNLEKNEESLQFARRVLSREQYKELVTSKKQLFWAQISVFISFGVLALLIALFVPNSDTKTIIIVSIALASLFIGIPIMIILTFFYGKVWCKYSKWYRKGRSMEELYDIFTDT